MAGEVGRNHTAGSQGRQTDPAYRNAVEKLKTGDDLAWKAEPRVVAEALNDALNSVRADRDRLREAISDALADLTPGYSPYSLLDDALRASEASSGSRDRT